MPNELSQPDPGLLEYRRPVPQKTKHLLLNAAAQEGWRCTYCKQVLDLSRETKKIKDNKQMKEHTFDNRRILVATMCDNSSLKKKQCATNQENDCPSLSIPQHGARSKGRGIRRQHNDLVTIYLYIE
jgi:hypothetical protein